MDQAYNVLIVDDVFTDGDTAGIASIPPNALIVSGRQYDRVIDGELGRELLNR